MPRNSGRLLLQHPKVDWAHSLIPLWHMSPEGQKESKKRDCPNKLNGTASFSIIRPSHDCQLNIRAYMALIDDKKEVETCLLQAVLCRGYGLEG